MSRAVSIMNGSYQSDVNNIQAAHLWHLQYDFMDSDDIIIFALSSTSIRDVVHEQIYWEP